MSGFFVGQRVRVRWANDRSLAGREGRVNEILGPWPDAQTGEVRMGYGLDISPAHFDIRRGWIAFADDQLEPILPEGAAPSEFTTLADLLTSLDATVPA